MSWWEFRGFWGILQRSQADSAEGTAAAAMMFVALAMFVRIFGKQGFVVAAFNQADQFCRTFRTFYLVAESTALFYRKIRMVINHHLALAADEVFEGSVCFLIYLNS